MKIPRKRYDVAADCGEVSDALVPPSVSPAVRPPAFLPTGATGVSFTHACRVPYRGPPSCRSAQRVQHTDTWKYLSAQHI